MTEQLQLELNHAAPPVDASDLATTLHHLRNATDWLQARDLTQLTGFDDRRLRAIASASKGHIISGNRGYRLTRQATIEEIDHCTAKLLSQADAMTARALQIQRVYHGHESP
jgi:hypothetical protein